MAPACALADVRADGARCWSATQKPHFLREAIAGLLQLPSERVRVIWTQGPGSYGHNDAGDAAADAVVLSQAVGKPVRVQGMRHDGTAWDPKGPASLHRMRAAIDREGRVFAYQAVNKGFSRWEVSPAESEPGDTLAGMLLGHAAAGRISFGTSADVYDFPHRRLGWECVPAFLPGPSPLRCSHLRDPLGPQNQFATECFLDELADATGTDPVSLRLRHLNDARNVAVIEAAAKRAGWRPGPPGTRRELKAGHARGMGIAFVRRAGTAVATVAEVEVELASGRIYARRFIVAHDCGLIINPQALRLCIEGNVMHGLSRTLCEAVTFDRNQVTSRDWLTYPVLDITEAPEEIDIMLIDRPDLDPQGAGEASTATVAAAVGNAVFDATGVRLRDAPLTPERFKTAYRQMAHAPHMPQLS
jgi:CO/xanthine dehydrogenase Mo-binding subunit